MQNGSSLAGRVNLTKYVNLGNDKTDKWRFCPVVRTGNGRIRPGHVLVNGKPEIHREGSYYIEWYVDSKRRRESAGKNPTEAFAVAERKAQMIRNQILGIEIAAEDPHAATTLAEACHDFLEEIRQQRRPKTFAQYKTALAYFREACGENLLRSIKRRDLINFMGFLADRGSNEPHKLEQSTGCCDDAQSKRYEWHSQDAGLAPLHRSRA